ncbi:MAG TPA: YlmH/Sll1252 family protein [Tissierellaceae bacterium]|nr:YlmH/Sll1252 family protein [Tissierellaceae bacterium]
MRINRDNYLLHITDKDKLIDMRKIIDKVEIVLNKHMEESTDFLDPYERFLAKSILNRFTEVDYFENGGISDAERKCINIFPYYLDKSTINKKIIGLRITGNLQGLSHKDYLGGILNLGIDRSKVGDILLHDDYTDFIIKEELSDFIILNLDRVGDKKVNIEKLTLEELSPVKLKYKEITRVLSSNRLDSYISACYNLSRKNSASLIKSGRVKVNWENIEKTSKEVLKGDMVSVRGYGRSVFHGVEGLTRKDNLKAIIRILI